MVPLNDSAAPENEEQQAHNSANTIRSDSYLAVTQYLAGLAPNINALLSSMHSHLEDIERSPLNPQQKQQLDKALASQGKLQTLLEFLMDFFILETGALAFHCDAFELVELVENAVALHSASAREKGITLNWSVTPEVPRRVLGDQFRLRQLLDQLLSNAVKFTVQGEVLLYVASVDGHIQFGVVDTGEGIDEDTQQWLLEPFSTPVATPQPHPEALGIGLALADRLIRGMGGQLQIVSAPGFGSEFSFSLDLPECLEDAASTPPAARVAHAHILVVTDNHNQFINIRNILVAQGYAQIDEITHFADTWKMLTANSGDNWVLIVDLPNQTYEGQTFISNLRKQMALQRLYIVALLPLGVAVVVEHANACLQKPIRAKELISALVDAARGHGMSPPSQEIPDNVIATLNNLPDIATSESLPVELEKIKQRLGSGSHILPHLFSMFRNNNLNTGQKLDAAIAAREWGMAGMLVNALKSNSGNIAATPLCEAANDLESALQEVDREKIESCRQKVAVRLQELLEFLANYH